MLGFDDGIDPRRQRLVAAVYNAPWRNGPVQAQILK
jgi:hypothetical protein